MQRGSTPLLGSKWLTGIATIKIPLIKYMIIMSNTISNIEFLKELKKFYAQEDKLNQEFNDGLITYDEFVEQSLVLSLKIQNLAIA